MYERYMENARKAIFYAQEESTKAGSPYIEPEHLLLGAIRMSEPELRQLLKLNELEAALRDEIARGTAGKAILGNVLRPVSVSSKRILDYAVEEADRLNSSGVGVGHLLLGIIRDDESFPSRFFLKYEVDLVRARLSVASLPPSHGDISVESVSAHNEVVGNLRQLALLGRVVQLVVVLLLIVLVARSNLSGKWLLLIGGVWLLVLIAWLFLSPSSMYGFKISKRHRILGFAAVSFALSLYEIAMYGWLALVGFGIYRLLRW